MKNPFNEWLKTDCGVKCNEFSSLTGQPYLENRLYHAYSAGMIDEYNRNKTLQATIDWYEQRVVKLKAEIQEKDRLLQEQQPLLLKNDSPV